MKKTLTLEQAGTLSQELRQKGKVIVLTNGCYDLLHVGHTRGFKECKDQGDYLFVAVTHDRWVKQSKGDHRPFYPLDHRMELLSSIEDIDYLLPLESSNAIDVIKAVHPGVYCKGGDYSLDTINQDERAVLVAQNTRIYFTLLHADLSSSNFVKVVSSE